MSRNHIIAQLRAAEPVLRQLGVGALYLFGAHARDEPHMNSDVEVFGDQIPGLPFPFLSFLDAYDAIESAVGRPVDYALRNGLDALLQVSIERDAFEVFRSTEMTKRRRVS